MRNKRMRQRKNKGKAEETTTREEEVERTKEKEEGIIKKMIKNPRQQAEDNQNKIVKKSRANRHEG